MKFERQSDTQWRDTELDMTLYAHPFRDDWKLTLHCKVDGKGDTIDLGNFTCEANAINYALAIQKDVSLILEMLPKKYQEMEQFG